MDFSLPDDILEVVFRYLYIGDRVRLRLVCKSWNRILMQHHIPTAPEAPWEILSHDSYNKPESSLSEICFKSLSDQERIYRFGLPSCLDNNHGGGSVWCCGSSHGWLAMMVGVGMNPDIFFLWNPLTGATRKLPPLSTLSFFEDCIATDYYDVFSSLINRVEVFTLGSVECVVAVLFTTRYTKEIALCTPGEAEWTALLDAIEPEPLQYMICEDIMFHAGKLMLLIKEKFPSETMRETFLSTRLEISLTDCQVQVDPVLAPYDDTDLDGYVPYSGCQVPQGIVKSWCLVESSITGEVLLVVAVSNIMYFHTRTCCFMEGFTLLQKVCMSVSCHGSDDIVDMSKEAIFLGDTGCISSTIVEGIVPDCIYFATTDSPATTSGNLEGSDYTGFYTREHGKFFVSRNKLCRESSVAIKYTNSSRVGWFTPQLFMF